MKSELQIIGRSKSLYDADLLKFNDEISDKVRGSSFLVIGAAGTIGQAVTKEIFKRNPRKLHAVDISENNLVELVRDLRSSIGYISGDFRTYALDAGDEIFESFIKSSGEYDYVLNLSALKHVRSEKDPYTLMRLIKTNILNSVELVNSLSAKHFCVSTDKAANPVNMMGASKSIMEKFMFSSERNISMARFANVAFSDGSLLHGFAKRIEKQQPISAPTDTKRYFVTQQESGELCLLAVLLGKEREIFFPKDTDELKLTSFSDIAVRFLEDRGYTPIICETEDEARYLAAEGSKNTWPCYFFKSDTTGEKPFEEFHTKKEKIILDRFASIGVVQNARIIESSVLTNFIQDITLLNSEGDWSKAEVVTAFQRVLPNFEHTELHKNLDEKM